MAETSPETWLVTGTSRGIGHEIVRQLLESGQRVLATVRPGREADLASLKSDSLRVLPLDVSDPDGVAALGASIREPVDVLINNAGVIGERNVNAIAPDLSWSSFEEVLRVNSVAPLFIARAVLPCLRLASGARILSVSSGMGSMAFTRSDTTAYRMSKAALNKAMQGLASDLRSEGIAVIVAHPGWVRTDMGGPGADIDTETSARGLIRLVRGLTLAETGKFFNYDGSGMKY